MKDAKAYIEEAIKVLDDNLNDYDALVRASGTAMGLLANALSSPCACGGREPIARKCTCLDGPVLGILILDVDSTDKAYDGPVDVLVFAANEGGKEQGDGA